jgi:hypothetical protein
MGGALRYTEGSAPPPRCSTSPYRLKSHRGSTHRWMSDGAQVSRRKHGPSMATQRYRLNPPRPLRLISVEVTKTLLQMVPLSGTAG